MDSWQKVEKIIGLLKEGQQGVLQGSALVSLLFNKFPNDVGEGVNSEMMWFADNMTGQSTGAVVCFSKYQHKCNVDVH